MDEHHIHGTAPSWFERAREAALEVVAPTRCAGCERPGELICPECLASMTLIDPVHACTRCGAPFGSVLCTECTGATGGASRHMDAEDAGRCLAATVYEGVVPRIIRAYKDGGERRLAGPIAELMVDAAEHAETCAPERFGSLLSGADAVTFVPATAAAYARRGFDHMEAIARAVAEVSDKPLVDALVKYGHADQRSFGREERQLHSTGLYDVVTPVAGMRLVLLDDVITTGSTMRAARGALMEAGAYPVDALVLARVW